MLGFVVSVLAVVCRQMQHLLPTMLGPAVHVVGRIQPIHVRLWRPCVMCVIGPNNVGRATVLCFGNHVWNKRSVGSCWLKSLTVFKLCTTTPNNTQLQHTTSCKRVHKRTQHVRHVTFKNVVSIAIVYGKFAVFLRTFFPWLI